MDINCTNRCLYQADGKCTLNGLPEGAQATGAGNFANDIDCLYFTNSPPSLS